jgi:hypothetical protein
MSSIIVERVLDLATIVLMFVAFAQYIPMPPAFSKAAMGGGVLVVVMLGAGGLLVWKADVAGEKLLRPVLTRLSPKLADKIVPKLAEITDGFRVVASGRKMLSVFFLTVVVWGGMTIFTALVMNAFLPGKLEQAGLMLVTTNLGGALPSAPGGLGIVQGFAKTALVIPFHLPEEASVAYVFVWSLGQQLLLIVLGVVSLARIGMTFAEVRQGSR